MGRVSVYVEDRVSVYVQDSVPCRKAEADFSKASIRSFNMLCTG